ncbi:MAG: HEAT repeat domain-containing protein [Spirochaetaceae bacterium]|nr:HEAT repeat domain-containing protein [Spirochaetaceae bacterium]
MKRLTGKYFFSAKKILFFALSLFVWVTSIVAQTSTIPEPKLQIHSADTELEESTAEVEESEKDKELNVLRYGLDDEIVKMLDGFMKEEKYPYLEQVFNLFQRTRTTSLREKIIMYFTEAKDPSLVDYTLMILEDPFDEKTSTVSLLFKYASAIKLTEAAPFAKSLLENDNTEYFDSALSSLAEIGSPDDAVFLATYLERDDLSTAQRQSVMKALGKLKAVETWDQLVSITQDEDENTFVRMYAAEAIGAMEKPESVSILVDLFESTDPNFRTSVVKALGHYPNDESAVSTIIEAIRDSHYKVRLEAISSIKQMNLLQAAPYVLYRAKNDPESTVKYACYDLLAELDYKDGIEYLKSLLKEKNIGDTAKAKVAEALLKQGSQSSVDAVIELAKETLADDKKKQLRYALGKLFASNENPAYDEICLAYLQSDDVSTVGTGLDIYAKNRFPSVTLEVEKLADSEKNSVNKTKARKILDR